MAEGKKFVSDDQQSTVPHPVTPKGGTDKVVDKKNNGDKTADKVKVQSEELDSDLEIVVEDSIQNMFEGMDLSEDFKQKVSVVFEAALHEQVLIESAKIKQTLEEEYETQLNEQVEERIGTVINDLDAYLGYVVKEWVQENEVAIEAGIKVDIAESLMGGLKTLFAEHNIVVDESTVDVVSGLEEEISFLTAKTNNAINENIRMREEVNALKAEQVFGELTESLTVSQRERLRTLSENLNFENIKEYSTNLTTLKESFFSAQAVKKVDVEEESELIVEETQVKRPTSDHTSINALVEALNARKSK